MFYTDSHIINRDRQYCVLGVMDNQSGLIIRDNMLEWLSKYYNVIEIIHDGTEYEYPALHYMQEWCIKNNKPCLYLHTRGAVNQWNTTLPTHIMWEQEFGKQQKLYFDLVDSDKPKCACPFTSPNKHTFYNGFVANAVAMKAIPTIQPSEDRMVYEDIFKDSNVEVIGTKTQNCIQEARLYLKTIA